ncbi:MAG: DUF2975 domain-containing protein [Pseudonocardia sp.]|uniref:DUF2975 domain-containing protein n=1 Tax=unclassified Pseudonocardia TaxID=2619320 RepID=UPI00086A6320|nr:MULTISPECIES: DUF2975 domain-containing protein [unclassified Pseudonocardia]MBN9109291.1 DUF2975 domain-containing protein [Pseudonocardia sp.]ODU23159.1 MAG: hypothetical protein ABS80_15780 [Pseudonocardia sp. SCN 72-51]ODV08010.1 MAG: hypothetical protein ABT15_04760 [Pseudonocardia sp. SCN 73-27]
MMIERRAIPALRVFLVVLFAVLLVFQFLSLPGSFRYMAEQNPDDAPLRWPATIIAGFWVLCVQVVIVATWQLLTRVRQDRIFSESSLRWVDVIVGAIGAGWLVLVAVDVFVLTQADDPGMPMLLLLLTAGVTVFGLLVVVLRALLRQATTLRTDLDAVI